MSRIQTSLHGRFIGLDSQQRLIVPAGIRTGDDGSQIDMPSPRLASLFEDFTGGSQAYSTTIIDGWRSRKGSDGACIDWTVTPTTGGTAVGTIGSTTASMAVSGIQLDRGLNWQANQGDLVFETRVKLSQITTEAIFIGFTDQTSALEMPIQSAASADTFTTNATDAVGVMFDTSMTTKTWWLTGVANDVDATMQATAFAPVAATYETWRIGISATGSATFFRNGLQVGAPLLLAVTPTIPLTPVIAGFNRTTTGTPTITLDYVHVAGLRA